MEERWAAAWRGLGVEDGRIPSCARIVAAYAEPRRRYHTLAHLRECFERLDLLLPLAERPAELAMAAWFHDAVYDPARPDNEARSAAWARAELTERGVDPAAAARVGESILATRHGGGPPTGDARLLVDADLAILGAARERFEEYERQIREEYAFVPEARYRQGRARILREFADRPYIYATETFRDRYEAAARRNLARSLAKLQDGPPA